MNFTMKSTFINWGLWIGVVFGILVALGIADITDRYGLPRFHFDAISAFSIKLTFFAVLLALGMFQYNYFYSESMMVTDKAARGDYGVGWVEYIKETDKFRELIETGKSRESIAHKIDEYQSILKKRDDEIQHARKQLLDGFDSMLFYFSIRLSLIFTIISLVAITLILDTSIILFPNSHFYIDLYSHSSFLTALLVLVILLLVLLITVQGQLKGFYKELQAAKTSV